MRHVEGQKPSPFMSTTAIQGGTVNPQGQTFGSSMYMVDLAYLPPTAISATYTDRGLGYFMLPAFQGTSEGKKTLVENAKQYQQQQEKSREQHEQKPSTKLFRAQDAEEQNGTLSAKEWQALMDVIRTHEILISARIPTAVLRKPER